jgi:glutamate N-acetyltransferase/amino-acid N-acetyltransferase
MTDGQPLYIPHGFRFASGTAGIKQSGSPDLVIAVSDRPASAAAMFTTNQFVAAPVIIGRRNLKQSGGRLRAVVVNSGNANCATGDAGLLAAENTCHALAKELGLDASEILPSSTGIIGVPLPVEKIIMKLPSLVPALAATEEAAHALARAIMTTDTRPKVASATFDVAGNRCSILGFAKGAGMIHPNMATMLTYMFTDIAATAAELDAYFRPAVAKSFNAISIDGDTSTNDTALIMANGVSGLTLAEAGPEFAAALAQVCETLAHKIVSDGEGVKHVVRLTVRGAESDYAAHRIADTISTSMLVKTAWAGSDPNWGRMVAAAGRSGETIDIAAIAVTIQNTPVCRNGGSVPFDKADLHHRMQEFDVAIEIVAGNGSGAFTLLTCDLTDEYVHINADYST